MITMRDRLLYAALALAVLAAASCNRAEGQPVTKLAGMTEDIYYGLCGIWVIHRSAKTVEGSFSWGKAQHVPQGSVNIDLGAEPPFLTLPGGLFHIRSVATAGVDQLRLELTWKRSGVEDTTVKLVVHFNEDGSMWWEPNGIMGQGPEVLYYKIDGPKKDR